MTFFETRCQIDAQHALSSRARDASHALGGGTARQFGTSRRPKVKLNPADWGIESSLASAALPRHSGDKFILSIQSSRPRGKEIMRSDSGPSPPPPPLVDAVCPPPMVTWGHAIHPEHSLFGEPFRQPVNGRCTVRTRPRARSDKGPGAFRIFPPTTTTTTTTTHTHPPRYSFAPAAGAPG
jgi:hypothetical protein